MITKTQIENWNTAYDFFDLIQGQGEYKDVPEELRVYACKIYIKKFFNYPKNSVLALKDALFITAAKDEQSQKLLLGRLINNEVIVHDEAWDELADNVKSQCIGLVLKLRYKREDKTVVKVIKTELFNITSVGFPREFDWNLLT